MSRSVNRVILVGNVGADPDVRTTASGRTVAHLSLATNRLVPRDGEEAQQRTDWHRLTFWAGAAETVERYVRRGNRLYVEGRIEYGAYDREGVSIPTADVVVQEFVMLDGRNGGPRDGGPEDRDDD
ncbi:MAG: single-stranded DNA-binding protein [Gemmatimonadota bacterium]|nr:single-stranded DNA-binding protein [Gemmatimonadota bacterium]